AARQVDHPAIEPVAQGAPEVLLDQAARMRLEGNAVVLVERGLDDRGDEQPRQRERLVAAGLRVAYAHLDGPEAVVRAHAPPDLGRLDYRAGGDQEVDVVRIRVEAAVAVGDPAAREALREDLGARRVQAGV